MQTILSDQATEELNKQMSHIQSPGGLIHIFDAETGSLLTASIAKNDAGTYLTGWNFFGPMTEEQARKQCEYNPVQIVTH